MSKVSFVAMRHAVPSEPEGNVDDPGIDAEGHTEARSQIEAASTVIDAILGPEGKFLVYAAPARRTLETGRALLTVGNLRDKSLLSDIIREYALSEAAVFRNGEYDRGMQWWIVLRKMARCAVELAETDSGLSVVMVTHATVVQTIPNLRRRNNLNLNHGGINQFRIEV